jgi:hypothetical protein
MKLNKKERRESGEVVRDTTFNKAGGGGTCITFTALKLPRQLPLVLL